MDGALRLERCDPAPPAGQPLVPEPVRPAKYFANWLHTYSASIVTKVSSTYRSMARSAGLTNGVNEVIARRSQTAVQGRFWLQGLDPMGFAIYSVAFCGRVASCSTVNRSAHQTDINSSAAAARQTHGTLEVLEDILGPRAIAARSARLARMKARARRVTDAQGKQYRLSNG